MPVQRRGADLREKGAEIGRRDPALLLLLPEVDLDEAVGEFPRPCPGFDQSVEQRSAVERMNGVEQFDGLGRFVGLQPPDHVEFQTRMRGAQGWPFRSRLLHPAFAEGGHTRFD
jgi:hypothetical protein